MKVNSDMPPSYCLGIAKKYGIKVGEVNKLIPHLRNKDNYILHYKNLQLYKSLGMKVKKNYKSFKI